MRATAVIRPHSLPFSHNLLEGSFFLRRIGDLEQTQFARARQLLLKLSPFSQWDVLQTPLAAGDDPGEQAVSLVEMLSLREVAVEGREAIISFMT